MAVELTLYQSELCLTADSSKAAWRVLHMGRVNTHFKPPESITFDTFKQILAQCFTPAWSCCAFRQWWCQLKPHIHRVCWNATSSVLHKISSKANPLTGVAMLHYNWHSVCARLNWTVQSSTDTSRLRCNILSKSAPWALNSQPNRTYYGSPKGHWRDIKAIWSTSTQCRSTSSKRLQFFEYQLCTYWLICAGVPSWHESSGRVVYLTWRARRDLYHICTAFFWSKNILQHSCEQLIPPDPFPSLNEASTSFPSISTKMSLATDTSDEMECIQKHITKNVVILFKEVAISLVGK